MKSERNKGVAILLALLLGGLGAHRFYMGRILSGFLYLLFCWTFIPMIVSFIEALLLAITSNKAFQAKCR
jgi:TM2 domain-containing membrane protein YozV